jgi:quercetin dioxygenase-like cupin family protein
MKMKIKSKVIIGITIAGSVIGGLAWGTPIINLASPILATGNQNADIETNGSFQTKGGEFRTFLKTEGPSSIEIQDAAYSTGGVNGWHSHPGLVAVTMITGTIQWYDEDCRMTTYKAGDSWTEGSQVHYFRVTGTTGIHLMATFIIAQGYAPRIDQPAPACAAGLGLD